ncbi:hypothetical protein FI667_g9996, partial [Globisporangium splendens]
MSLAQSPLLPTNSLDELLSLDGAVADVLPFTGAYATPFIAVHSVNAPPLPLSRSKSHGYGSNAAAPPPSLSRSRSHGYEPIHHHQVSFSAPPLAISRSSSYGYESDASCTSVSGFPTMRSTSMTKTFRATPTSIEAYYTANEYEYDPYTQLATLWSTPAAQAEPQIALCYDVHDDLVDLFSPTPKAVQSETPTTTLTISTSPVKSTSYKTNDKPTKLKSTKAIKKCTYAARRVSEPCPQESDYAHKLTDTGFFPVAFALPQSQREVSALRRETSELETQLRELQAKRSISTTTTQTQHTRESAELEKILLARAQEENERLLAIVKTQEVQIRRCDSLFPQIKTETTTTEAA